jgi:hypothetical protein
MFFSKYFGFSLPVFNLLIMNFHSSTIDYMQSAYRQHCSVYYKEITQCDPYGTCRKSFDHSAGKDGHFSRELGPHSFGPAAASTNHEPVSTHTAFFSAVCSSMYVLRSVGSVKQIVCPESLRKYN